MSPVEQVLLIRHGQTDWNVDGRWQGTLPVGLNDVGRAQAKALASHLSHRRISSIYASDLPRAFDTAKTIGDQFGIVPITDMRLQEFNLGVFQGLTRDEIRQRYPLEYSNFEADYWNYVISQGESRRALQNRAYAAFNDIVSKAIGPEVAIVSHGGTIRMLLLRLFDGLPELNHFHVENTSLTIIVRIGDMWKLEALATVPHL